ncbi:MAG TPA: hypothetical protein VG759_24090 [Candidatus Angelobacter sp.]|nr:hypothetical protein [Candidatus Angelobacter sp.]
MTKLYKNMPLAESASGMEPSTYEFLRELSKKYAIANYVQVGEFLSKKHSLEPLLAECYSNVTKFFGHPRLRLELFSDPEGSQTKLFVIIPTDLPVKAARQKLRELDENWWLDASARSGGDLNIDLEYL